MDSVQLVDEKIQLPKEMNDVRKLVVELVKDLMAKKELTAVAAENLPLLYAAFDGMNLLPAEAKDPHAIDLGAILAADLLKVLLGK